MRKYLGQIMGMDDEWKKSYENRAKKDLPEHEKGYWTEEGYAQLLRITLRLVKKIGKEVDNILDVGCGVGRYCHELSKLGHKVVGVDYSEALVEEARKNYPGLTFEVDNGYDLKHEDKSFDLVISIGALQCLEDHERFIKELCRVSKKYVLVSTLLSDVKHDLDKELEKLLKKDTWPTRDYHPDHLTDIFDKAGFKTDVILKEWESDIRDGFFIIAVRK
jgi:SAM-dependent methyltransferase